MSEREELEDALRTKHEEVFVHEALDRGGVKVAIFYRCPTPAEAVRAKNKMFDDKNPTKQAQGADELGRAVVVHPSREDFEALCERRPLLASTIAGDALGIASGKEAELGKRL